MSRPTVYSPDFPRSSPFLLGDSVAYNRWREWKLRDYPVSADALRVPLQDLNHLTRHELEQVLALCSHTNMCLYQTLNPQQWASKEAVINLGKQLGLHQLDQNLCADEEGLSSITVADKGRGQEYIPYTDRPINWHTDGYYNTDDRRIRGMTLHCVSPAAAGGENQLLDPEIAYILLRDENPAFVQALMAPDAMTIPENVEHGQQVRPAQSGPVFAVDARTQKLHMRYTHRTRSIQWREDTITQEAVCALRALLEGATLYRLTYRLRAGEGVICNNVLHTRTGFRDDPLQGQVRLVFRARYHDRITAPHQ